MPLVGLQVASVQRQNRQQLPRWASGPDYGSRSRIRCARYSQGPAPSGYYSGGPIGDAAGCLTHAFHRHQFVRPDTLVTLSKGVTPRSCNEPK